MNPRDFYSVESISEWLRFMDKANKLKVKDLCGLKVGEYDKYSNDLKEIKEKIKEFRKSTKKRRNGERNNHNDASTSYELLDLKEKAQELQNSIKEIVDEAILKTAERVSKGEIELSLKTSQAKGSEVVIASNLPSLIASQTITKDLNRSYHSYTANRDLIIKQIIGLLDNHCEKTIVRIDIRSFFDSIPQNKLFDRLNSDDFLQKRSLKYLRGFFYAFNNMAEGGRNAIGLPRGLSFSSSLSELFMRDIDLEIVKLKGIVYYKRYVDDIIIIGNPDMDIPLITSEIKDILKQYGLTIHENDNKFYQNAVREESSIDFEYLGYRFCKSPQGKLCVMVSERRMAKYADQIRSLFEVYSRCSHYRSHKSGKKGGEKSRDALSQLASMLRTLTGNGLLYGYKKNVATGIYFSNKYLTDLGQLEELDRLLCGMIDDPAIFNPQRNLFDYGNGYDSNLERIKTRLKKFSFVKGFKERRLLPSLEYITNLKEIKRHSSGR